jgi:hypothetical protein
MAFLNENRTVLAVGAGLAILAGVVLAMIFAGRGDPTPEAPPATRGGLTVNVADAPGLEPTRELRCFVNGQFIGMATLADCARRNGLATDALDVGLDETGALAAAPTAAFAPPPEAPPVELAETPAAEAGAVQPAQSDQPAPVASGCLRYAGSEWRAVPGAGTLNACVQALFAGQCVRPGDAQYGRFGDTTLRLVPRRVEQSGDNNRFRTLTTQNRDCQFPDLAQ